VKLCVRVVVAFLLSSSLALLAAGCAPDSGLDDSEDVSREQAALSVPFETLAVTKSASPAGITVIKNKAQFKAFFGVSAPSDISFMKSWVIHYSLGIQNTGGYAAEITGIERTGFGASKLLTVHTRSVSPGPACMVTMALTNPQVTVEIPRQAAQIPIDEAAEHVLTDCSEPNWCAAALCAMGTFCDEAVDTCVEDAFCPKVKCANGYECDEAARACVPRLCDPTDASSCPANFACENQIQCITTPCPGEFRCVEKGPCGDVTYEGLCTEDNILQYCQSNELFVIPCGAQACGWDTQQNYFDCL
jgi:hypothetical protein